MCGGNENLKFFFSYASPQIGTKAIDRIFKQPSNETQDDGEAEEIQESAEAAFAASSQGT
jgi:hypothetical protein